MLCVIENTSADGACESAGRDGRADPSGDGPLAPTFSGATHGNTPIGVAPSADPTTETATAGSPAPAILHTRALGRPMAASRESRANNFCCFRLR